MTDKCIVCTAKLAFQTASQYPCNQSDARIKYFEHHVPKGLFIEQKKKYPGRATNVNCLFRVIIRRLQKEVAVNSRSLSRGLFNVYWLIESKCLGEFSWISLLYRLGVMFTKRLLVQSKCLGDFSSIVATLQLPLNSLPSSPSLSKLRFDHSRHSQSIVMPKKMYWMCQGAYSPKSAKYGKVHLNKHHHKIAKRIRRNKNNHWKERHMRSTRPKGSPK